MQDFERRVQRAWGSKWPTDVAKTVLGSVARKILEQNRDMLARLVDFFKGEIHLYEPDVMEHLRESQRRFGLVPSPLLDSGWRARLDSQLRAKALEAEREPTMIRSSDRWRSSRDRTRSPGGSGANL